VQVESNTDCTPNLLLRLRKCLPKENYNCKYITRAWNATNGVFGAEMEEKVPAVSENKGLKASVNGAEL
jgi:hypothetical protein